LRFGVIRLFLPSFWWSRGKNCATFSQNRLPWQRPLRYQKRGPDRSSAPKMLSFSKKIAKIVPADPGIICLREIIKNINKNKKKIN